MGTWSFHPMGSDNALDYKNEFFNCFKETKSIGLDSLWNDNANIQQQKFHDFLIALTTDDLDCAITHLKDYYYYVIPYAYYEYKAFEVSSEIKTKLKELIKKSICRFCNGSYNNDEYNFYQTLLDINVPETSRYYHLYHLQTFLYHFDEIFDGQFSFNKSGGLLERKGCGRRIRFL